VGWRFDFDPELPQLAAALDPSEVATRFEAWWSAPGTPPRITVRKVQDVKYQPSTRCVAAYDIEIDASGGGIERTIGVIDVTPARVALRLYTDDTALPGLRDMLRPQDLLQRVRAVPGLELADDVVATPVRYKPSSRCVFHIRARTPSRSTSLFGKMLAERPDRLMAALVALDDATRQAEGLLRIAPPVAYWPDLHMVIQAAVPGGVEFHRFAFDGSVPVRARLAGVAEAGATIAFLHGMTTVPGPRRLWAEDIAELDSYLPAIDRAAPEGAPKYAQVVARLRSAASLPEPASVASHGAFRTDQFLMDQGRLVMVDLDTFCWSNPSRDLGNFMAYLGWRAIRRPAEAQFVEQATERFLQGYEGVRALPDNRWIAACTAGSLLKIAGRRFRSLTVDEWRFVPHLVDRARRLIVT
jgi:hypothetical protein